MFICVSFSMNIGRLLFSLVGVDVQQKVHGKSCDMHWMIVFLHLNEPLAILRAQFVLPHLKFLADLISRYSASFFLVPSREMPLLRRTMERKTDLVGQVLMLCYYILGHEFVNNNYESITNNNGHNNTNNGTRSLEEKKKARNGNDDGKEE